MAEGEGFEPPRGLRRGGFQDRGPVCAKYPFVRRPAKLATGSTLVLVGSCGVFAGTRAQNGHSRHARLQAIRSREMPCCSSAAEAVRGGLHGPAALAWCASLPSASGTVPVGLVLLAGCAHSYQNEFHGPTRCYATSTRARRWPCLAVEQPCERGARFPPRRRCSPVEPRSRGRRTPEQPRAARPLLPRTRRTGVPARSAHASSC
jgi:hypothetical protein